MSKAPSKATLKQFIKDNESLLTAIGVTGALAAFFTSFTNGYGIYPALISFAMLLVLSAELIKSLWVIHYYEETLSLFKYLTFLFPPAIFLFIIQSYWNQIIFRTWFLPLLIMEVIGLTIPALGKKLSKKTAFLVYIVIIVSFLIVYILIILPHFPSTIFSNNGNQTTPLK